MLRLHRLLHPTDFSDGARAAYAHALHLARAHGASVDVLTVAPLSGDISGVGVPSVSVGDGAFDDLQRSLDAYARAADTEGVAVRVLPPLPGGAVVPTVLEAAAQLDSDLIVMGTHGRHGLRRVLLGSVAEGVVRRAPCPVLTVPAGRTPETLRHVAVAVDFAYHAGTLVREGAVLAGLYGAALTLLHVVDGVSEPDALPSGPRNFVAAEADARRRLAALRTLVPDPAQPVALEVAAGFSLDEVPAAVERLAPDLVVLASHGYTGVDRLLMGSVADRLIRQGHRAVFVDRPGGKRLVSADGHEELPHALPG